MTFYEFGIMSSRYRLKARNIIEAKLAMVLYFKQDIPIAIYKPQEEAFRPIDFLSSKPKVTNDEVKKAWESIKKLQ